MKNREKLTTVKQCEVLKTGGAKKGRPQYRYKAKRGRSLNPKDPPPDSRAKPNGETLSDIWSTGRGMKRGGVCSTASGRKIILGHIITLFFSVVP